MGLARSRVGRQPKGAGGPAPAARTRPRLRSGGRQRRPDVPSRERGAGEVRCGAAGALGSERPRAPGAGSRSHGSAGPGKHRPSRRPAPSLAPPGTRSLKLRARGSLRSWRPAPQVVPGARRGRAAPAAGDAEERSELRWVGRGVETPVGPWSPVTRSDLTPAVTLHILSGLAHGVCRYYLLSTLRFRPVTRCLANLCAPFGRVWLLRAFSLEPHHLNSFPQLHH